MTTTLARKTRRAFFFVLFTPLLLGIVVALELHAYQQSVNWVTHTNEVLSTMDHLLLAVTRAESAQRAFLLSRNPTYLNWFSKAQNQADVQLSVLRGSTADNGAQQQNVVRLRNAVQERFQMMSLLVRRATEDALPASEFAPLLQSGTAKMQQIWDITHLINQRENSLLGSRRQTERVTAFGVGVSFLICIVGNLTVLLWAYRLIKEYGQAQEDAADQILSLNADLEQRVAERTSELELANSQLKRSNDDLTKFAYVASHDLQEPLRTIGSYVGLLSLRYQGKLDDQADRYIKFVVEGAKRMQVLVQDLLIYSRVGTESLKLGRVNMESVLRNVRDNLDLLIREQQVSLTTSPLPTLPGDESKLTQVIMNLVGNAIKFRRTDDLPRITIEATLSGAEWVFSVHDNGIGFEEQYAERIFTIFQRLHGVGSYPGTGMGLAICKRIIEQHRGRIWATSNQGNGSTFFFTLPVDAPAKVLGDERNEKDDRMEAEAVSK